MDIKDKVLILGYGSIGRRHAKVLKELKKKIAFVRSGKSTISNKDDLSQYSIFYNLEEALDEFKPLYVVDCTPSIFHMKNLIRIYEKKINALIEKPLIIDIESEKERKLIDKISNDTEVKYGISYQYRFHPIINKIKEILENLDDNKIFYGNVIWTEYLPNWHPWEDFKKSYASNKNLYGGSFLTMCHPFDYLKYILGNETNFKLLELLKGRLNINVDQSCRITCSSEILINNLDIYLDFDSRINRHTINLEGKDWSIFANLFENKIKLTTKNNEQTFFKDSNISRNSLFKAMHKEFQEWLLEDKHFRSKLKNNIDLINFMSYSIKK